MEFSFFTKLLAIISLTLPLLVETFSNLLTTFANSLDSDQDQHFVGPDLDPNCFDTLIVLLRDFFLKFTLKKVSDNKCMKN